MRMQLQFALIMLLIGLMVSCASLDTLNVQPVTPTPSPESFSTPTEIPATATSLPTSSPSTTTPQEMNSPTPEVTSTPADVINSFTSQSPDDRWETKTVLTESPSNHTHVRFTVTTTDGTTSWTIVDEDRQEGLGFPSPTVLRWVPEDQRLFYTEATTPDGCPLSPYYSGLYTVDLTTGAATKAADVEGYLAVSPTGERVAYRPGGPMRTSIPEEWQLVLRTLSSEDQEPVSLPLDQNTEIVNFVWSADANSLLVVTATGDCIDQTRSVLLVDLASGSVNTLIEGSQRRLYALEWTTPATAILRDEEGQEIPVDIMKQ